MIRTSQFSVSLRLHARIGRDLFPNTDLFLDLGEELRRRAAGGRDAVVLQLVGGLDFPMSAQRSFRTEMRLQFFADTALVVLGGLSF